MSVRTHAKPAELQTPWVMRRLQQYAQGGGSDDDMDIDSEEGGVGEEGQQPQQKQQQGQQEQDELEVEVEERAQVNHVCEHIACSARWAHARTMGRACMPAGQQRAQAIP